MSDRPVDIDRMRARLDDQGSFGFGDSWRILDEVRTLRARIATLESRPTYEDGVRAALACVDAVRASHCLTITDAANCIYALLEPTE